MKLITNLKKWSPRVKNASLALLFFATYAISAVTPFVVTPKVAAAFSCVDDTSGPNDEPGQKDLTQMCVDYDGQPVSIKTTWNWDERGTTGANTLDACNLFDTDNDGFVNYAVCATTGGTPAVIQTTTTYSCGDDSPDRCTSPNSIVSNGTTVCDVAEVNTDPFPTGTLSPIDMQGSCTIDLTTVGGVTAKLIDVCSYPSQQPNSDPSDCVVFVTAKVAKIQVIKDVVSVDNTGLFNLTVDGPDTDNTTNTTTVADQADGGTTGVVNIVLPQGGSNFTASVYETAGTGTSLTDYNSSISCVLRGTTTVVASGAGTSLSGIPISDGSDIVCTITNAQPGSITIIKDAKPNRAQDFGFTATGSLSPTSFSLDDDENATLSNSHTFAGLAAGSYSVSETGVAGWDLKDIVCTGSVSGSVQVSGPTATIQLAAGEHVICTYTNVKRGSVTVNKVTDPAGDTTAFPVAISGTGTVTGDTAGTVSTSTPKTWSVSEGSYSVSETSLPAGWTMTSNTCTPQNLTILVTDSSTEASLQKTCTITNTKLAKLRIVKDALPNDPQDFAFTTTGTGLSAFSLDDDSDGTLSNSQEFVYLAPGTYAVTETPTDGWSLTGLSCDTNNFTANGAQVSVQLAAGQVTTCTYTNTKFGSISGTKYEVNADGSTVAVEPSGWIITLFNGGVSTGLTQTTDANGYYEFTGLLPGAYSVTESSLNGWTQVYNPLSPINLLAGQEAENNNFGNFKNGSISGYKFNDLNGQGGRDVGEPGISGWGVTLTGTTKAVNGQPSVAVGPVVKTTNTTGYYEFTNLAPGTYTVCEEQRVNWVQTYPGLNVCQTIVIDISGESNANSNFGNRAQGTIEVKKVLSPATDPGKFNLAVDGETQASNVGDGGTTGQVTVWAGDHTASEAAGTATDLANYSSTYSCSNDQTGTGISISDITVSAGDHIVCTFTNTRNTGTITVIKQVVNDNGGTAAVSDFNLYVNGDTVTSNVANTYNTAVSYTVSEDTKAGYTQTSLICTLAGLPIAVPFTLQTGQNIICTITNDDIAPKLIVKKVVDNGITNLTKDSGDFTMNVDATNVSDSSFAGSSSGTTVTLDAGSYSVTEGSHSGYAMTASADCTGTVEIGEVKTCTITNTAIEDPGISVVKTGPAFAHEGDTVTYTFTVKNTGNVAFPSGSVIDDVAGDDAVLQTDDDNGVLDQGETWVFTIDYVIPANTTSIHNTVTACGQYGSDELMQEVCDEDDHTLTVLHPGIKVVKSGPVNAQIGTIGTYTFTVTNTGDTPLTMDSVVDNLAGNGIYVSGDINDNDRLDLNESWVFQAKLLYSQNGSIVNTVKACAVDVLKGEVCSSDSHTTIVYTPQVLAEVTPPTLEDTGNSIWIAIILSASITTLAVATTLQRRRYDSANK